MTSTSRSSALVGTVITASWGPIYLSATEVGVVAVDLMASESDFRVGVERRLGRQMTWARSPESGAQRSPGETHLWLAASALAAALTGEDADLISLSLDLADRPDWDRAVLAAVRAIPRGETKSYGEIARTIGRNGAARAVGGAVGRNPIGFIIPCHRVIAGDGTLGGYGGGWWGDRARMLDLKAELLLREGHALRRGGSGTDRRR